jgi:Icc-related predicted phosphoesterase
LRVAAISDLHGFLPDVPACDVLLIAGDVCPVEDHALDFQRDWLGGPFSEWLRGLDAARVVGIAGNHDFVAEAEPELMRKLPWTYLCDETVAVDGLRIHGSPWTPTFMEWAFMHDEAELAAVWALIPTEVDILMTHGPPFGHGDLAVHGLHCGSHTLAARLPALERLRLHVFGHIHEGWGSRDSGSGVTIANVSHVDFDYRPVQAPTVFEL